MAGYGLGEDNKLEVALLVDVGLEFVVLVLLANGLVDGLNVGLEFEVVVLLAVLSFYYVVEGCVLP